MGSIMTISVYGNNGDEIERTIRSAFDEAKRLEQLMSNYRNDSELSRINRLAPDKPVNCDAELLYVIETSLHYSNLTNGAFDITVSPMVNLWGFFADNDGNINGNIPDDKEIMALMPAISYKNILTSNVDAQHNSAGTIFFKNPLTRIDLGAIGKGYAVDKVVEILKRDGVESALVNFAGNISAYGSPGNRDKWTIGLRDPKNSSNIVGSFKIKNGAVSTSGDYERYFVKDGKRYTHIIDPRTGKPVSGILSVTIVTDNATKADALSTGVFVLSADEGFKLIEELDNVEGVVIFENDNSDIFVKISKGFNDILELNIPDDNWTIISHDKKN